MPSRRRQISATASWVSRVAPSREKTGGRRGGTRREQVDRVGRSERLDQEHRLGRESEWLLAGGQDTQAGRAAQQQVGELGRRLDDVLAVVQDEESTTVAHGGREPSGEMPGPPLVGLLCVVVPGCHGAAAEPGQAGGPVVSDSEDAGDRLDQISHAPAVARELDQPDPVRDAGLGRTDESSGSFHGQPGLADTAGPGQGDEARAVEEASDLLDRPAAADQRGERDGEVGLLGAAARGGLRHGHGE